MKKTQNACKVIGTETQKKMNRSVFNWYKENFPNDFEFFGKGLNKELTFADVLAEPWNFYEAFNTAESEIRELVFTEITNIQGFDYDNVFLPWVYGDNGKDWKAECRKSYGEKGMAIPACAVA